MNIRATKLFFALLLIAFLVAGCSLGGDVKSTAVAEVQPSATLKPATLTATSIPTDIPTETSTPTVTPSPAPTSTATVTLSSRTWEMNEMGNFISLVGSWFTHEISYPPIPREGDEVAQLIDEFVYHSATDSWSGPIERVHPDVVCAWALDRLNEGYSLKLMSEGNLIEEKTREERWTQFSFEVGNPDKEPYCTQFDVSFGMPVFDDLND